MFLFIQAVLHRPGAAIETFAQVVAIPTTNKKSFKKNPEGSYDFSRIIGVLKDQRKSLP